jgi:hypothetical protein
MAYKIGNSGKKMIRNLRIAILKKFDSQADFSMYLNVHESTISRVIRGRRK